MIHAMLCATPTVSLTKVDVHGDKLTAVIESWQHMVTVDVPWRKKAEKLDKVPEEVAYFWSFQIPLQHSIG